MKSSTPVLPPLSACDVCAGTVRVCILIHYSAPLASRSRRAAALAVTGQPGIHESVITLSSPSVLLPFIPFSCSFSLFTPSIFVCLIPCSVCHSPVTSSSFSSSFFRSNMGEKLMHSFIQLRKFLQKCWMRHRQVHKPLQSRGVCIWKLKWYQSI